MTLYGDTPEVVITGALGADLSLAQCPREYRPFMIELGNIGRVAQEIDDEDSMRAIEMLSSSNDVQLPTPRMERVERILERGVGGEYRRRSRDDDDTDEDDYAEMGRARGRNSHDSHGSRYGRRPESVEGRAIAFANRVNALALGMTKLRAFRERQDEVFKILSSIKN
jgi:hypothetical protein